MKPSDKERKLSLNRETVRDLDEKSLRDAAGGAAMNLTRNLGVCYPSITACDCTGNYTYQGCS